jgi:hypothetical protein
MTKRKWQPGDMRTGGDYFPLTVGELRAAIAQLDEDVEIGFGGSMGGGLQFYRFKWHGPKMLCIELREPD